MQKELTLAVTGDSIINRRISVIADDRFLSLIKVVRDADVGFTHLETLIHDYDGPEVYPAAEGGHTFMRSPRFVLDELKWAGFDMVSHASNHAMDYSFGGLLSTLKALDEAGIPHAGTGKNLAEAREPAYLETTKGRVALISMATSVTGPARAGEARSDVKGRPGVNTLRYYHVVDAATLESLKQLGVKLGWWMQQIGKMCLVNPAGLHQTLTRYVLGDQPGVTTVADEDDAEGNLRSVRDARRQADWVLVHHHSHEWDPDKGVSVAARFVPPFARACIDAGADAYICQGSHALLRGIEVYKGKPIFYDTGDFLSMSHTVTRLPADFYARPGYAPELRSGKATPADAYDARLTVPKPFNPPGGYRTAPVVGGVVAACSFGADKKLTGMKLYPYTLTTEPRSQHGVPLAADAAMAKKVIEYLAELSSPFGTKIAFRDGIGVLTP